MDECMVRVNGRVRERERKIKGFCERKQKSRIGLEMKDVSASERERTFIFVCKQGRIR